MLLHIFLNIEVINTEVLSKQVKKLFEIHFNITNTFFNFICDLCLVAKGWLLEAPAVVDKTRKKG